MQVTRYEMRPNFKSFDPQGKIGFVGKYDAMLRYRDELNYEGQRYEAERLYHIGDLTKALGCVFNYVLIIDGVSMGGDLSEVMHLMCVGTRKNLIEKQVLPAAERPIIVLK